MDSSFQNCQATLTRLIESSLPKVYNSISRGLISNFTGKLVPLFCDEINNSHLIYSSSRGALHKIVTERCNYGIATLMTIIRFPVPHISHFDILSTIGQLLKFVYDPFWLYRYVCWHMHHCLVLQDVYMRPSTNSLQIVEIRP